jgi:lipid-A-disaccharide synthase
MTKLFIFAGEKSGDLHGYHLIRSLDRHLPGCHITSVAGPEMRTLNTSVAMPMEEFEVMGFSDVICSIGKIVKQFRCIRDTILASRPDAVVFIDYPGFNLRMAKSLRKNGYQGKLIQYIAPGFWAWGYSRVRQMIDNLDLLLTIYPFENKTFEGTRLNAIYVGNPVQESIRHHRYQERWAEILGIPPANHLIALFPGSRRSEVHRNLPLQLKAAELFKKDHPDACFALSCAHPDIMPLMEEILETSQLRLNEDLYFVPKRYAYELMRDSRSAIAKSGTVTLELALHRRPTVVMYEVSRLNYFIVKYLIRPKISHACIANILYGKTVFPELIDGGSTPEKLYHHLNELNADGAPRKECLLACEQVDRLLQNHHTSEQAALAIKSLMSRQ